jgi:hypothetical protein
MGKHSQKPMKILGHKSFRWTWTMERKPHSRSPRCNQRRVILDKDSILKQVRKKIQNPMNLVYNHRRGNKKMKSCVSSEASGDGRNLTNFSYFVGCPSQIFMHVITMIYQQSWLLREGDEQF